MLKQLRLTVFTVLIALFAMSAHAQVNRVIVLPFDSSSALEGLQVGLPTAVQLSLHQLDGVFVPSIGDAALVASKAQRAEQDVFGTIADLFNAHAIVSGEIQRTATGYVAEILVQSGGSEHYLQASGANPRELVQNTAEVVAEHVVGRLNDAQKASIQLASEQTPSEASLYHLGFATAGLPGVRASDLGVAARVDADSAWLQLEYARLLLAEGKRDQAQEAFEKVTTLPEVSDLHVLAGVLAAAFGDEDGALQHYNDALRMNSANAMALAGRASLSVYPDSDALASAQEAQSIAPRLVEAHVLAAGLESNESRAVQVLLRAERNLPDSVLLRSLMVDQYVQQGDYNGALTYLRDAVKNPFNAHPSIYGLVGQFPSSAADRALAFVEEGLEAFPGDADLLLAQADLFLTLGRYNDALQIAASLHERFPTSENVVDLYAAVLVQSGQTDDAAALLIDFYGQSVPTELVVADFFITGGYANEARARLEKLLADEPSHADVRALYGTALLRLGMLADAESQLNEALRLAPEHRYAQHSLNQLAQQRELLQGAEPVELNEAATVKFQHGLALLEGEDYLSAAAAFAEARELDDHGLVAFYHGYALHRGGKVRDAIDAYIDAQADLGQSAILANNLGYAYLTQGRYDRALPELRRAIELDPNHAQAHLNLGLTFMSLGRADDARASLQQAAALDVNLTDTVNQLLANIDEAE